MRTHSSKWLIGSALAGCLATSPALAQVIVVVDDVPGNDSAYVDGVGGNFSGANAVQLAVAATSADASGQTEFFIRIVDTDGAADTYTGDLHIAPLNTRRVELRQFPNGNGNDAPATLVGAGAGVAGAAFLVQGNGSVVAGLSPDKPMLLNAGGNTFVTGAAATGVVFENLDYVATGAPFDHNDFFGSSAAPFAEGTTWRDVTLRNSNSVQVFNDSLFERVNFFGPGFPFVVQGGQQTFINCQFSSKAGPMHFGGPANNSGATFTNCTFQMAPTRILSGNPADGGVADLLSTGGTFHFIDPVFVGSGGDIAFHLGNRNATLIIEGTDPENKVDLDPMVQGGTLLPIRLYSGNVQLINVKGSQRAGAGFMDATGAQMNADISVSMDKCNWLNGAGDVLFSGTTAPNPGEPFNVTINAVNTIWAGGTPAGGYIDASNPITGTVEVNLEHCTMVGPTGNVLIHSTGPDTTAGLTLNSDYSIFDSTQTASTFASGLVALVGQRNLVNGAGFGPGMDPSTLFGATGVDALGRISAGSIALENAIGSTLTFDIDGELRPSAGTANPDIGADESEEGGDPFIPGWPIQAVRIPNGGTAPTIDGVVNPATEYAPTGVPIPTIMALSTLDANDPYFPDLTHTGGTLDISGDFFSDGDGRVDAYFVYDANAFYFGAVVSDESLNPNPNGAGVVPNPGAGVNAGDAFQLVMDFDNSNAPDGQQDGTGVYIPSFAPVTNTNNATWAQQFWPVSNPNAFAGMTWAVQTGPDGYTVEARIPWSVITSGDSTYTPTNPFPPADGQVGGMMLLLDDHDGTAPSQAIAFMLSAGSGGNVIVNASQYNNLLFVESPTLPTSVQDWSMY